MFNSKDMGIDLGTANTLIYVKDSGIILNEPSVIAVESNINKILAVGKHAKDMIGKAPRNINVVRPLQDGVISDFDKTADMLKAFIEKAMEQKKMIICQLIKEIRVFKDYNIEIEFNISYRQFLMECR